MSNTSGESMDDIRVQLKDALKNSMRARNQREVDTIRGVLAAVKQIEVDTRSEVDRAGIVKVVQKEVKKRRDALEYAQKAEREDLIEQNLSEIAILERFLPQQLSEEKLEKVIEQVLSDGADNLGAVMGALNKDFKGQFDGKLASTIAKRLLSVG